MEEIKVGVEEKKKTQGMRRDLAHHCGPSPLFLFSSSPPFWVVCFLLFLVVWFLGGRKLDEKENWEVGDTECVGNRGKKD